MYIIAEAGVNHNGSEELALQLIKIAADAGADAVKFQTFKANKLVLKGAATASYQKKNTGNSDQYNMLESLELPKSSFRKLFDYCRKLDIEFLSTPFDMDSAQFLINMGMKKIKIPSGEITNLPFIKSLAKFNVPIILSTGMSNIEEVQDAINTIKISRDEENFIEPLFKMVSILHCTSNYPASDEAVNLNAILTLKKEFNLPIGYSDHTEGIIVSVAAVAIGATIIEKHFTIDQNLPGPDHRSSIDGNALKTLIADARRISRCLGDGQKIPAKSEEAIKKLVRRSIVLTKDLSSGQVIQDNHIELLRPGNGISPKYIDKVLGSVLNKNKKSGDFISWEDLD